MSPRQILAWLRWRAPQVAWEVIDTGRSVVISAPYPSGVRHIVELSYAECAGLRP